MLPPSQSYLPPDGEAASRATAPLAYLDALFHGCMDGIALLGPDGGVQELNASAAAMFGLDRRDAAGRGLTDLLAGHVTESAGHWLDALGVDPHGGRAECRGRRSDGNPFPVEVHVTRVPLPGAAPYIATLRDLTDARAADQAIAMTLAEMEQSNRRYEAMLQHAAFAIVLTTPDGAIEATNPAARRLLGLEPGAVGTMDTGFGIGTLRFDDFICHDHALPRAGDESAASPPVSTASWLALLGERHQVEQELVIQRPDGARVPVLLATSALRDGAGGTEALLHIAYDITARRRHEARMRRLAFTDPLTGLGNRALLEQELDAAIGSAERQGRSLCLLFIDLDRFKPVNDAHGHAVGDAVLQEVGRRLQRVLRTGDLACRLGGDEFVVLLPAVRGPADGERVAEKLREVVAETIAVDHRMLCVEASVGVVTYPDAGTDVHTLLHAADQAMYEAKRQRRR